MSHGRHREPSVSPPITPVVSPHRLTRVSGAASAPLRARPANPEHVPRKAAAPALREGRSARAARRSASWSSTCPPLGSRRVPRPGQAGGHEVEEALRQERVAGELPRAVDRLVEVRDHAVAPATHLVAEDPKPSRPAAADRTFDDDATLRGAAKRDRRHLDHEPALRDPHLERRVVEIAGRPPSEPCCHALVHAPVQPDRASTCAERKPVEMRHRVRTSRSQGTLAAIVASMPFTPAPRRNRSECGELPCSRQREPDSRRLHDRQPGAGRRRRHRRWRAHAGAPRRRLADLTAPRKIRSGNRSTPDACAARARDRAEDMDLRSRLRVGAGSRRSPSA